MSSDAALDLRGVEKVYKKGVRALQGMDIRIDRGEVFGLLGPNGAGKSTLIKILMTVIRPTRCEGHMLGSPIGTKSTLARIGYLPEHHRFPDYLTGAQVLDFYAAMAGVPRAERKRRAPELLELVGMSAWADRKIRMYSKGMRQRVGIAQALMNDPDLVLLDEPTDGVDPVGRRDIRRVVERIRQDGRTVLLNSHLLSELEMVCDRVAILVQGRVRTHGTIDDLTVDQRYYEIEFELEGEPEAQRFARFRSAIGEHDDKIESPTSAGRVSSMFERSHTRTRLDCGTIVLATDVSLAAFTTEARRIQQLIDEARRADLTVKRVHLFRPSLEDLFMDAVTDLNTGKVLAPGAEEKSKHRAHTEEVAS